MIESVTSSARLIGDRVRADAYDAAIRSAVRSGHVVLDVQCGVGFLSLLACGAGAGRVYALETSDAIETAKEIAAANRIEQIEFIQRSSTDVTLPQRADVVIARARGALPLTRDHLPALIDARHRHLAPGGRLIPQREQVYAALAEAPREYARTTGPWRTHNRGFYMEAARRVMVNSWTRVEMGSEQLLSEPQLWATLDYSSIESPHVRHTISLQPSRRGVAHGLVVWFDATLLDGIGYSNAPGERSDNGHGCAFFPFTEPLDVDTGDRVAVELIAELGEFDYVWTWTSSLTRGTTQHSDALHQSTLLARPLTMHSMRKRAAGFAPILNAEGEVDSAILRAMTGDASVEEIAASLLTRFPDRFRSEAETVTRVRALAERYSL